MTRAEATARVVAAARQIPQWGTIGEHAARQRELRDSIAALDACPPEPTTVSPTLVEVGVPPEIVHVPRDLHDARALAWAGWQEIFWLREQVVPRAWDRAFFLEDDGTWPTRDAEHAAWAGRYRAKDAPSGPEVVAGGDTWACGFSDCHARKVDGYWRCDACPSRFPPPPETVDSALEHTAESMSEDKPCEPLRLQSMFLWREITMLDTRMRTLETAVMGHECAGPAELIDSARLTEAMLAIEALTKRAAETMQGRDSLSARLDALAAQVGQMAEQLDRLHTHSFATARLCDERERRRHDGGPDA